MRFDKSMLEANKNFFHVIINVHIIGVFMQNNKCKSFYAEKNGGFRKLNVGSF